MTHAWRQREHPAKRNPPKVKKKLRVDKTHLWWALALVSAQERRPVHWEEFSQITGLSRRAIRHIMAGDYIGGTKIINALMTLRDRGVMIHLSDFEVPSTPESSQTSEP